MDQCTIEYFQIVCNLVNPCNANPCNGANEVCVVQTGGDGFACNCQVGFSRNSATNLCEGKF